MRFDRDAPPVVHHPDAAIGEQGHVDAAGVPGHRLVDRVVHNLLDEVVQTTFTGRADVHTRTLPDGFEPLEYGDGGRVVVILLGCHRPAFSSVSPKGSPLKVHPTWPRSLAYGKDAPDLVTEARIRTESGAGVAPRCPGALGRSHP